MSKKITSILLLVIMVIACSGFAYAGEQPSAERINFDDGSYVIVTTTLHKTSLFASNSKGADKIYQYYETSGKLSWSFTLSANFTYDGTTAKATWTSCSSTIADSTWSCTSKSATYSGAKATGNGAFKKSLTTKTIQLTLTCTPSGTIS